ncbi:MAG: hypothetical protein QOG63_2591 [Thermoleophilaceae bacterium]|nr:hypothetical protein [Thermoleophilaceae bacterium]
MWEEWGRMALANVDLSLAEDANRLAQHHAGLEDVVQAYASASEVAFAAGLVLLALAGVVLGRRRLLSAARLAFASAVLALLVGGAIGLVVDRARPFVAHPALIHDFLRHAADSSFPSDHATAAFAIGGALVLRLGVAALPVLLAAVALAVSRVMLGVHYPTDVIAGALIGLAVAFAVYALAKRWRPVARRAVLDTLRVLQSLRGPGRGEPGVHILLMHAWGLGGTIRTALNVAGYLTGSREVELLSMVRRADDPFFPFPPGLRVTAIDDQRPESAGGPIVRRLRQRPSLLMHPTDSGAARACSLWTDVMIVRTLWRIRSGVLIGTRPSLNMIAASVARRGLAALGEEHMNLTAQPPRVRAAIEAAYPRLDVLVTLTAADRDAYAALLGEKPRTLTIPNAVPAIGGPPADLSSKTIIAVGRLKPQKDFPSLVRAFARIAPDFPDWTLRICGGGPERGPLKRLVAELGLRRQVVLSGPVSDIAGALGDASIYALSSRFEGFPMALIEAMTKGLPAVSYACETGPREVVVTGRNGILVERGDEAALAEGLRELMADEDRRREYGAAAARDAAAYSLEAIGPRWDELLGELSQSRNGTRARWARLAR